jgi:hypothetical protein
MSHLDVSGELTLERNPREDPMLVTIIIIALAVIGLLALVGVLRSRA